MAGALLIDINMENVSQFIGRFPPLLVHLPIGILLVAILFDAMAKTKRFQQLEGAVIMLYLLGGLGATFSCLTGFLLSSSGDYEGSTLLRHQWLGISVAVVSFVIFYLRGKEVYQKSLVAKVCPLLLFIGISITGHLGGTMTHGDGYLLEYAPAPIQTVFGVREVQAEVITNIQEALVYEDLIVPLLREKCYKCHSDKKQKGKLRLDSPDFITMGGKSKTAILAPGLPDESELIRRLHLPVSDKKHMPPKRSEALTDAQVQLLEWWIQTGASYDASVQQLPQEEAIKSVLVGLEGRRSEVLVEEDTEYPKVKINPADAKAIAALQAIRAVVLPVGQGNPLLSVNFINVAQTGAAELALLEPIREHIVWLRMSDTDLDDSELAQLATFPNLTKLYLDDTQVTDAGIGTLTQLSHLRFLNLVGTQVSYAGLAQLKGVPTLTNIYVHRTLLSSTDKKRLMAELAPIVVDTGGYYVPTLVSDTTLVYGE